MMGYTCLNDEEIALIRKIDDGEHITELRRIYGDMVDNVAKNEIEDTETQERLSHSPYLYRNCIVTMDDQHIQEIYDISNLYMLRDDEADSPDKGLANVDSTFCYKLSEMIYTSTILELDNATETETGLQATKILNMSRRLSELEDANRSFAQSTLAQLARGQAANHQAFQEQMTRITEGLHNQIQVSESSIAVISSNFEEVSTSLALTTQRIWETQESQRIIFEESNATWERDLEDLEEAGMAIEAIREDTEQRGIALGETIKHTIYKPL
jgi:hypothetical protein